MKAGAGHCPAPVVGGRFIPSLIQPIHEFRARSGPEPAFAAKQNPEPPVPETKPGLCQLLKTAPQNRIFSPATVVAIAGSRQPNQPARPSLARLVGAPQVVDELALACRLRSFFKITSRSMCLSSDNGGNLGDRILRGLRRHPPRRQCIGG